LWVIERLTAYLPRAGNVPAAIISIKITAAGMLTRIAIAMNKHEMEVAIK
jgi:hypothetical protein